MLKFSSFLFVTDKRAFIKVSLTHIRLASFCGTQANGANTDQTQQNAASDQGLHNLISVL